MADDVDALGAYEAMAEAYVADEGNAYNSLYERPAMLGLLGDVAGSRVSSTPGVALVRWQLSWWRAGPPSWVST